MPRGGKRPGAGRPKGTKEPKTLEKEAARTALRERVLAEMGPLVDAQIANAKGIRYLVVRNKAGKFIRRVDENMDPDRIAQGEEIVEVWLKDPSVQAFTDLMNRAIDKPAEQLQKLEVTVLGLEDRIKAANARINGE